MTSQLSTHDAVGTVAVPSAADELVGLAREVLETLLQKMGLDARVVGRMETEIVKLEISGRDTALIIGRKGGTLEALQLITNKLVRRLGDEGTGEPGRGSRVIIDTEGYRERRNQGLETMAHRIAANVRSSGRALTIMGMRAADRRVMHLALSERSEVSTRSEGEGRARKLLITPCLERSKAAEGEPSGDQIEGRDEG